MQFHQANLKGGTMEFPKTRNSEASGVRRALFSGMNDGLSIGIAG
jgi:hypothetical protein